MAELMGEETGGLVSGTDIIEDEISTTNAYQVFR